VEPEGSDAVDPSMTLEELAMLTLAEPTTALADPPAAREVAATRTTAGEQVCPVCRGLGEGCDGVVCHGFDID